ncbi:MAG: 50S ribosomal protein L18 [Parcubacteria group bacterium]|nr:50S ribosomal protein L18 [Parcubacteria group bacterium]
MSNLRVKNQSHRIRRHKKVRAVISGSAEIPRLYVFRSSKHIYAAIVDDKTSRTLTQVSDLDIKKGLKSEKAGLIGKKIAEAAKKIKIKKVVFDRGGYKYHGRIKQLAEAARLGGLEF